MEKKSNKKIDIVNSVSDINKYELVKNISIVTIILYPIILMIFNKIFNYDKIGIYLTYFIVGSLFIPGMVITFGKNRRSTIIMLICFWTTIILNYVFHFKTFNASISIIIKSFITCYLMFIIVVTIKDKDLFFKSFKVGGYIAIILTLIYIIMMNNNKTMLFESGLSIQLVLVIFIPINLIYAFKDRKSLDIVFSIIGILIISCFSSRTVIFTMWSLVGLLTTIYYIKWLKNIKNKKNKNVMIIITVIILLFILIIAINIQRLSTCAYNFLQERGVYIRTLRLLSEGKYLSHSSGRTEFVYPAMINKILENPIIGHGIGMDRVTINGYTYYAHNIILELCVSYGIIITSMIIIAIIMLVIKALKTPYRAFIIGLIFSGLIILLLTTSYTVYRGFWILLGVLINLCFFKDKEEN